MGKALERVRSLIARAVHPDTPVEEARTSAMIACKLIAEHKLLDNTAEAVRDSYNKAWPEAAKYKKRRDSTPQQVRWEDILNDLMREAVQAEQDRRKNPFIDFKTRPRDINGDGQWFEVGGPLRACSRCHTELKLGAMAWQHFTTMHAFHAECVPLGVKQYTGEVG